MSDYPLLDRRRCIAAQAPSRTPASMPRNDGRRGHQLLIEPLQFDLMLALAAAISRLLLTVSRHARI